MPNFTTTIGYLSRNELYATEKPYDVVFDTSDISDVKRTNHTYSHRKVQVHDLRDIKPEKQPTLDINGFTWTKSASKLAYEDFGNDEIVRERYYPEVADMLRQQTGSRYAEIVILDHELRRREAVFPYQIGATTSHAQPLTLPHVDFSPHGAQIRLDRALAKKRPELMHKPYEVLNVWRTIKGPNDDWPLLLLDWQSLDAEKDQVFNDIVYADEAGENVTLHPNPRHKWYYLSAQETEDVLVFRACGSADQDTIRAFHVAAENPLTPPGQLRESIDVRLVAFLE